MNITDLLADKMNSIWEAAKIIERRNNKWHKN
jgi:hypothetical protein